MSTKNVGLGGRTRGEPDAVAGDDPDAAGLILVIAKNLGLVSRAAVGWAGRHPATVAALMTAAMIAVVGGALGLALLAAAVVAGLVLWSRRSPSSFRRHVVSCWAGSGSIGGLGSSHDHLRSGVEGGRARVLAADPAGRLDHL